MYRGNEEFSVYEKKSEERLKNLECLYSSLIDDETSVTIASASTLQDKSLNGKSKESAKKLGTLIADLAKKQNIQAVVFDRGHNKYHGVLAELANAARESGLHF